VVKGGLKTYNAGKADGKVQSPPFVDNFGSPKHLTSSFRHSSEIPPTPFSLVFFSFTPEQRGGNGLSPVSNRLFLTPEVARPVEARNSPQSPNYSTPYDTLPPRFHWWKHDKVGAEADNSSLWL
jgi:hypothetical protein